MLVLCCMVSCGQPEPDEPTPTPVTPDNPTPPAPDTTAPTITISNGTVNVIAGLEVTVSSSELKIGDESVAVWKDDMSSTCTVELILAPKEGAARAVKTGDKLSEDGTLQLKVTDEADNSAMAEINLTREDSVAPTITVSIVEKNVIAGVTVSVIDNQLLFEDSVAATWTDDYSSTCSVELSFTAEGETASKSVKSGDVLTEAGTLALKVTDDFENKAAAEISLTAIAVYGFENLSQLQLKVDQEADLLEELTFAECVTLGKVEVEADGERIAVSDASKYTPSYPGDCRIILTVSIKDSSIELSSGTLTILPLDYNEPAFQTADLINEQYPWFNNLTQWYKELGYDPAIWNNKKEFVYPHILVSYIT